MMFKQKPSVQKELPTYLSPTESCSSVQCRSAINVQADIRSCPCTMTLCVHIKAKRSEILSKQFLNERNGRHRPAAWQHGCSNASGLGVTVYWEGYIRSVLTPVNIGHGKMDVATGFCSICWCRLWWGRRV